MACGLKQDISIGENLQKMRRNAGYTQEQASARLELMGISITPAILAKIEQGKYSVKISVLLAMKEIYKVDSFDQFFENLTC